MALAISPVSGGRLYCLRLSSRGLNLTPGISCHHRHHARLFSSILLQRRSQNPATNSNTFRILLNFPRHYSKSSLGVSSGSAAASTPSFVPEETASVLAAPVDLPTSEHSFPDAVDTSLTTVPPPLELGDLASLGLISWTPAGLIRWSLELLNVSTGLPWFHTIILGTLLWRVLLAPLSIQTLRNTARLLPIQPRIVEVQGEMQRAKESGDKLALQRVALKMAKLYKDAGVSFGSTMLSPFVQIPVTFGLFFGIRKMCALPVVQLTNSGVSFLPDLTVADPYMILPLAVCAVVNLQISVGARDMNLTERPEMGHIMNGLRILTVLGVWVMSDFPSGLMLSLLVTSGATTVQSLLLQYRPIRSALNIPTVPREMQGKLPSYKETIRYCVHKFKEKAEEAAAQQRRNNRRKFK